MGSFTMKPGFLPEPSTELDSILTSWRNFPRVLFSISSPVSSLFSCFWGKLEPLAVFASHLQAAQYRVGLGLSTVH